VRVNLNSTPLTSMSSRSIVLTLSLSLSSTTFYVHLVRKATQTTHLSRGKCIYASIEEQNVFLLEIVGNFIQIISKIHMCLLACEKYMLFQ
jgi:hypothetical protein